MSLPIVPPRSEGITSVPSKGEIGHSGPNNPPNCSESPNRHDRKNPKKWSQRASHLRPPPPRDTPMGIIVASGTKLPTVSMPPLGAELVHMAKRYCVTGRPVEGSC